jgi:hypothetical protein
MCTTLQKLLPGAAALDVVQVAYACKQLGLDDLQLMSMVVQRSNRLLQHSGGQHLLYGTSPTALAASVGNAVAALDMQQLTGDVRALVLRSRLNPDSQLRKVDAGMLWEVHSWMVKHQLLDRQGLAGAGLLSEQQLEEGRAAFEAYHAQKQQQQQDI